MLIDTHCHLDAAEFDEDRPRVIRAATEAGVARLIVPAVHVANFPTVARLAADVPSVRYALGIHPMYTPDARESDLSLLRDAVKAALPDPAFIGVGEIGLDFFVPGLDADWQERVFVEQLRMAVEFDLPVILHVRRAQDAVLKQLRRFRPSGGIAHAFNGSRQQAETFLSLGFALGFGGAFTWNRALQIRRLVAELPAHAHVLETDAPDIAPAWLGKGRNAPAELAQIARVFAELRHIALEDAIRVTGENAQRVLPRLN